MTIQQILHYPDPALTKNCASVDMFDEELAALCKDLQETAKSYNAEGLAANQIGKLVRVFVIKDGEEYITCVNPEILQTNAEVLLSKEGCLSFPGVNEVVKRAESVHVQFHTERGEAQTRWLTGVPAVAFQHELDHLYGITFLDHMGKIQRRMALKKLAKVVRSGRQQWKKMQNLLAKMQRSARV